MPNPATPTVKQQRDARRAEKVAALKKRQAASKRAARITIIGSIAAGLGLLALIITIVVTSSTPKPDPASLSVDGIITFPDITSKHVDGVAVDYEAGYDMNPPAGGDHWSGWLNCGVYSEVQESERAVHSLEHGAVWVTYDPTVITDKDLDRLRASLPRTYTILSPYPDLPAPIVASAWGVQVQLDGPDDERLATFILKYWKSAEAPEPGAPCTGGVDGPGRQS